MNKEQLFKYDILIFHVHLRPHRNVMEHFDGSVWHEILKVLRVHVVGNKEGVEHAGLNQSVAVARRQFYQPSQRGTMPMLSSLA